MGLLRAEGKFYSLFDGPVTGPRAGPAADVSEVCVVTTDTLGLCFRICQRSILWVPVPLPVTSLQSCVFSPASETTEQLSLHPEGS